MDLMNLAGMTQLLSEFADFRSVGKLFQSFGVRCDTFVLTKTRVSQRMVQFQNRRSHVCLILTRLSINRNEEMQTYIKIYMMKIQRASFLKKKKSVRTKVRIKSFKNLEPINFFKVLHSNLTSVIQLETIMNRSILDSLQFTLWRVM